MAHWKKVKGRRLSMIYRTGCPCISCLRCHQTTLTRYSLYYQDLVRVKALAFDLLSGYRGRERDRPRPCSAQAQRTIKNVTRSWNKGWISSAHFALKFLQQPIRWAARQYYYTSNLMFEAIFINISGHPWMNKIRAVEKWQIFMLFSLSLKSKISTTSV